MTSPAINDHRSLILDQSPSIETTLLELAASGWTVNNLFQLSPDLWQCNLRSPSLITDYAIADTPSLALSLAIDKIESAQPIIKHEIVSYNEPAKKSISDLLKSIRPKSDFKRRI